MINKTLITENQLDSWVRGNAREAQEVIVELVWRLVAASSPRPKERRFPLGDSIGQSGPDGILNTDFSFDPFVPEGRSFWEIGTGTNAQGKATSDYRDLTRSTSDVVRHESTFVFVTPLSGRRDWQYTWKKDAQASWLSSRRKCKEWRDIRVIDGSCLIDWLHHFPAVDRWLAEIIGFSVHKMQTPEQYWTVLRMIGAPPPLSPRVFLANREEACERLGEVFSGDRKRLRLDTHFPTQVKDFVAAYVANMGDDARVDATSRCLIISDSDAWGAAIALHEAHILVADFSLACSSFEACVLFEKAHRAGHAIIFAGLPGGRQQSYRVTMPNPKGYQIQQALEEAGYEEERARVLSKKSGGNLGSLLRCLQNLPVMPEWVQRADANELAIAALIGAWSENSEADRIVVETLSANSYKEWIRKMREIALQPGTPLIQRDGDWRIISRYEAWYALGPRLFDEHLDCFKETVVSVLSERDPQFELPPDDRFAACIHGKVLAHSRLLRNGLAECLALLGSNPQALSSCSLGKAETTAILAVREILANADWEVWASLNELLPLLAEAAPNEFLKAVEDTLNSSLCPFNTLFQQERTGIMGRNYMTGLLWALETLAWDSDYLTRVIVALGELAARDPGGSSTHRPLASLSSILLPCIPQTCAPITKRDAAVITLFKELPDVAWRTVLELLPSRRHQTSWGSRRPTWREMIPDDWSRGATEEEYREQVNTYAELAVTAAKGDVQRTVELIRRLHDLPRSARNQLLDYLRCQAVVSASEEDRFVLWYELIDLVLRHRKYEHADWAMEPDIVAEIADVAGKLVPNLPKYRHQRLFTDSESGLYDRKGSYEEQRRELERRRKEAIDEIFANGGIDEVIEFAEMVELPWCVGFALAEISACADEEMRISTLLESEVKAIAQFVAGFVCGMFRRRGWQWIDLIDMSRWTPSQKAQLLAYLPFAAETWERANRLLKEDEPQYWSKVDANPCEAEERLEWTIERLIEHDRPSQALKCLEWLRQNGGVLNPGQVVRVLVALSLSPEELCGIDACTVAAEIKALQHSQDVDRNELLKIEWIFLAFLDECFNAYPRALEQELADDPEFFCKMIRTAFPSKRTQTPIDQASGRLQDIAKNAYRVLTEWRTPPGSQRDGTFDGDALTTWLATVKSSCIESGHLEVALLTVGRVLIHAPPDPDGLWLHRSALAALEAKDAEDIQDGFITGLINARGAYWGTAGREEQKLAEKYYAQADEIDVKGYYRLASSLRSLAALYEYDAEREASEESLDS